MASNLLIQTPLPVGAKEYAFLIHHVETLYTFLYVASYPEAKLALWALSDNVPRQHRLAITYVYIDSLTTQLSGVPDVTSKAFTLIKKAVEFGKKVIHYEATDEKIRADADAKRAEAEKIRAEAKKVYAEAFEIYVRTLRAAGVKEEDIKVMIAQSNGALSALQEAAEKKELVDVNMN